MNIHNVFDIYNINLTNRLLHWFAISIVLIILGHFSSNYSKCSLLLYTAGALFFIVGLIKIV